MAKVQFNLELFSELNDEYREKPLVPKPRTFDKPSLDAAAVRRLKRVKKLMPLDGARVLEIGAGRGHVCRRLADDYGCTAVGVDIKEYPHWAELADDRVDLITHDVSSDDNSSLGKFDVILSFAVWEHIEHPFAALRGMSQLLAPGGSAYIYANLYRGPQASHRYREIFFPWPHLLFTDQVFRRYYFETIGERRRAAWVNKLTAAHYVMYFDELDLVPDQLWFSKPFFDEPFYQRFEDVLGPYPRFDLSHDFIHTVIRHRDAKPSKSMKSARDRARAVKALVIPGRSPR